MPFTYINMFLPRRSEETVLTLAELTQLSQNSQVRTFSENRHIALSRYRTKERRYIIPTGICIYSYYRRRCKCKRNKERVRFKSKRSLTKDGVMHALFPRNSVQKSKRAFKSVA